MSRSNQRASNNKAAPKGKDPRVHTKSIRQTQVASVGRALGFIRRKKFHGF